MRKIIFAICICLSVFTFSVNGQEITHKQKKTTRVMSYNIRNCIGMDGKMDIDRLADVLNKSEANVIGLQELDSMANRTGKRNIVGELAEKTGTYPLFSGAINFDGGKYGIGMLSKEKPLSYITMPLPGREEARTFLIAEFKKYFVCCTHLSLTEEDQITSVGLIVDVINELHSKKPVFLVGDMNAEPDSKTTELFKEHFYMISDPKQNTFPSDTPNICIDYIYQFKNTDRVNVTGYEVITGTQASDHLPIFNDIKF